MFGGKVWSLMVQGHIFTNVLRLHVRLQKTWLETLNKSVANITFIHAGILTYNVSSKRQYKCFNEQALTTARFRLKMLVNIGL